MPKGPSWAALPLTERFGRAKKVEFLCLGAKGIVFNHKRVYFALGSVPFASCEDAFRNFKHPNKHGRFRLRVLKSTGHFETVPICYTLSCDFLLDALEAVNDGRRQLDIEISRGKGSTEPLNIVALVRVAAHTFPHVRIHLEPLECVISHVPIVPVSEPSHPTALRFSRAVPLTEE